MKSTMQRLAKYILLGGTGGAIYALIELAWRGYTHWTMVLLGGLAFVLVGLINNILPWEMRLQVQVAIGTVIVTALELAVGLIVNRWLGWGVWDYSNLWGNVLGQICPQYTLLWSPLVLVGIVLDDYLRWLGFGEDKPRYTLF